MRLSGRFIVDKPGAKPRQVEFDETGKTESADAHSYDDALDTGRRFNTRAALRADQRALLEALKPEEQDDLLDRPEAERTTILREMAEAAARPKPATAAPADAASTGKGPNT